ARVGHLRAGRADAVVGGAAPPVLGAADPGGRGRHPGGARRARADGPRGVRRGVRPAHRRGARDAPGRRRGAIPEEGGGTVNDVVLAIYSDRLFMAAVGVYVLAMALHAAEYAALRSAHEPAAVPVSVGGAAPTTRTSAVGGSAPTDVETGAPPSPDAPAPDRPVRSRADRFGGAA